MDIQIEIAHKYLGSQSKPSATMFGRKLSFSEEEKFFSLVRAKKYKQAYDLGEELKRMGSFSTSIGTFCTYIKTNLLNLGLESEEDEEEGSETSSEEQQQEEQDESSYSQDLSKQNVFEKKSQQKGKLKQEEKPNNKEIKAKQKIDNIAKTMSIPRLSTQQKSRMEQTKRQNKNSYQSLPQINNKHLHKTSKENNLWNGNMHKWKHNCKNQNCPNAKKQQVNNGMNKNRLKLIR